MYYHIGIHLFYEALDHLKNPLRFLIRNQTRAEFHFGAGRNHSFHTGPLITPRNSMHLKGRHGPYSLHYFAHVVRSQAFESINLLPFIQVKSRRDEVLHFGFAQRSDIVVKAGNFDTSRFRVIALTNYLRQLTDRITGGATRNAGMSILRMRFECHHARHHATKAVRNGRFVARDPHGIGDQHGIGRQFTHMRFQEFFKMRTTDFFFEFPEELNIDRNSVFARVSRAKKSS